jgi:hypothetical protein
VYHLSTSEEGFPAALRAAAERKTKGLGLRVEGLERKTPV